MDCPYRDPKCYFAQDRRYWDLVDLGNRHSQPVELGTIECHLEDGIECPWDTDPYAEDQETDPAPNPDGWLGRFYRK